MRKKKPTKKKLSKKKSASRGKKMIRRKKPLPPMKAKRSKGPSGGSSAQIHEGVGAAIPEAENSTKGVLKSDLVPE
jgi:hypothetical protein